MADIRKLIAQKAIAAGMDPNHALTMASIETGGKFDPRAVSPTGYKGLFQFGPREWKSYGGGKDIFDPEANADAFVGYHGDIKNKLKESLGREPTPQELYLGWQQGAAGAAKLLANPEKKASEIVPVANIVANGGRSDMTAADFTRLWTDAYNTHNKQITGVDTLANINPSQYVQTAPDWQMYQKPVPAAPAAPPIDTPLGVKGLLTARTDPTVNDMGLKQGMGLISAGMGQQSWTPSQPSLLAPHRGEDVPLNYLRSRLGLLG